MQKILLISPSSALEDSLGTLLDSPRHVARVSSWKEAHRLMAKITPATVLIGGQLIVPSVATEMVRLNDVLAKDEKKAYLLGEDKDGALSQWTELFETFDAVISPPKTPRDKKDLYQLLKAHISISEKKGSRPPFALGQDSPGETEEIVVRLPEIKQGTLNNVALSRIAYCLFTHKATGVLELSSGNVRRRFAFSDGRFLNSPDFDDSGAFTSAYAWPSGEFQFEPRSTISGSPQSLYALMISGLRTHRNHRQIMEDLMPRMSTYPVASQLWERRAETLDWPVLERFIILCNGTQTLEDIFSQMGRNVTEAFCSAVFARDTDLVVFRGEKTATNVRVQYDKTSGASTSRSTSSTPSKADRASGAQRADLEQELTSFFATLESLPHHDVFGLWKGCGRELVKETYYRLVKEHHPDVYGGNASGKVHQLSQRIFIEIRTSYTELMKVEGKQTVAPPDTVDTSAPPQARRRQMTTLHPGQAAKKDDGDGPQQRPGRRKHHTSPIRMGRDTMDSSQNGSGRTKTPAGKERTSTPARATVPPKSRRSRTGSSGSGKKSRTRSSGAGKRPRRTSSSTGIGNVPSDPEKRREKLQRLERSSSRSRRPTPISATKQGIPSARNKGDRARGAFNAGYKKFKDDKNARALEHFQKAHEAEPENGLYITFYAYCLFLCHPEEDQRSAKLLKKAIETKNKQALPDAHLFLGKILKVQGDDDKAHRHFKKALSLNPGARDAEREIRLYERRHGTDKKKKSAGDSDGEGFLKKLFKK